MPNVPTLAVCCVCKHVAQSGMPSSSWTPMSTFLERHHLQPIDVRLTHTYCPLCYEQQAAAWAIGGKDHGDRATSRAA